MNTPVRYLITFEDSTLEPFLTNYFDEENNFDKEAGMVVYDLHTCEYTTNGKDWCQIQEDHL